MKSKQDKASAKKAAAQASETSAAPAPAAAASSTSVEKEVEALVEATKPGKSAKELLVAYEGREEELVKNLQKLKDSKRSS